jgi:glycosyltransferase involved in cell wall biosynthesis
MEEQEVAQEVTLGVPPSPWVTVVLPAHNEAPHIGQVAGSFLEAALSLGREAEVLVVDDASSDDTAQVVRQAQRQHLEGRLRLIQRPEQGGYGEALRTGFAQARGEWVFFTDGDGQLLADDLPGFLADLDQGHSDMVLGYRHPRRDKAHRRALGRAWTVLMRSLFRVHVRDMNCAYKAVRRRDLVRMRLASQGALINAELLHKARRLGLRSVQRPVRHQARCAGQASGARPEVIARALWELARYRVASLVQG